MARSSAGATEDPRTLLRAAAPWLLPRELGTCIVGTAALAEACRRTETQGPRVGDLDLAWALDVASGERLLREHGVFVPTTEANRSRGTLACKLLGQRIEVTSYRGPDDRLPLDERLQQDLARRETTVGALAWRLEDDRIFDPLGGLTHYAEQRIVPCGDPRARVEEHPIRWVRWYRRAIEWGFDLEPSIRGLAPDPALLATIPREALAQELRATLARCASPGRVLLELHEAGILAHITPELAPQFDGRPAGPVRHHPEVSQALHVVLALEWAAERTARLSENDRVAVAVAVLCHDLGKNLTPPGRFPTHPGHERDGLAPLQALLLSLPGLADGSVRRLAEAVCALHLVIRDLGALRPGTLAGLYDDWFRNPDLQAELFALAIGADVGGRLGRAEAGDHVAAKVRNGVRWLRERCESIDAAALRAACGDDLEAFRSALHRSRAEALRSR